jgi:hypothetical protein
LLSGNPYTVIGVLPENFESPVFWPSMPEVWVPLGLDPNFQSRKARFLRVFGRLHPGSSVERAGQEFTALAHTLAREHPETNSTIGTILTPLQEHLTGQVRPSLIALLAAVGVLLLSAVANAAGLMLARVSGRTHEFAVRRAIGAGRLRIVRQLLTESVWLGVLGAAAALFVIWLSNDLLVAAAKAAGLPRAAEIGIRAPVVAFACGSALLAAILSVLVPAFQAARGSGNPGIGEQTRSATASSRWCAAISEIESPWDSGWSSTLGNR